MSGFEEHPTEPEWSEESEEVGYGKPPKHTQFKKGQSGNPNGRPKRECFHTLLEQVLDEEVTLTTSDGKKVVASKLEAVFQQMISQCMKGDKEAMKLLL